MNDKLWSFSFAQFLVNTSPQEIFPRTFTLNVGMPGSFDHNIPIDENGPKNLSFRCTWKADEKDLELNARGSEDHYYKGRFHEFKIERPDASTRTFLIGILGHKRGPYGIDGAGDEDNVVVFTGVKGPVDD
jgi:hypothetical protein